MKHRLSILAAFVFLSAFGFAAGDADAVAVGARLFTYGAPRPVWSSDGVLELGIDFSKFRVQRAFWDIPFKHDLSAAKGISFEYRCDNLLPIMSTYLYFKSGDGWYKGPMTLESEGKWTKMSVPMENFSLAEGKPAGLANVSHIRLSCGSADADRTVLKLRNFKVESFGTGADAPKILIVRSDYSGNKVPSQRGSFVAFASRFANALSTLGIPFELVSDLELSADRFKGKSLVILPYNRFFPKEKEQFVRDFAARGGKLLMVFFKTQTIGDLIRIETAGSYFPRKEGDDEIVGFLRKGKGLPGQPEFASNRAWSATRISLDANCRVWATWTDAERKRTDLPAIIETPGGMFMTYVLTGGAAGGCSDLLYSMIAHLVPSLKGDVEKLRAQRAADAIARQKEIDAMPARKGERRLAWCINPFGLEGSGDWDKTARFLKEHNFTDVIGCFARAGVAFYESKVLPVSADVAVRGDQLEKAKAACRRYGIGLHAWKMCWLVGNEPESQKFYAAAEKEGRVMAARTGKTKYKWLCPGDKRNQDLEIEAMTELSTKGLDGIQFDFIRYVDGSHCFCCGCRERFEKVVGKVERWPNFIDGDKELVKVWRRLRCENITRVVRETHRRVREKANGVEISAAVFRNSHHDRDFVGQDWELWCKEGLLDFVCPMDYTSNWVLFRSLVRVQKEQHGKAKLYPGIGLSDYSSWSHDDTDAWRLARQIKVVRDFGLEGFTLFELDNNALTTLPQLLKGPLR
jgi:uncharacterized lipoprotein YddW (UPF0748 family)